VSPHEDIKDDMLFDLILAAGLDKEIDDLFDADSDAASELLLLIERLQEDQPELEDLCVPGNRFKYDPAFEVKRFEAAQRTGRNIYTVRYYLQDGGLASYRLLIGYHAQHGTYYALQVAARGVAYEVGSESFRQLLARYEQCGIPTYK
jgi:hypothetical protein